MIISLHEVINDDANCKSSSGENTLSNTPCTKFMFVISEVLGAPYANLVQTNVAVFLQSPNRYQTAVHGYEVVVRGYHLDSSHLLYCPHFHSVVVPQQLQRPGDVWGKCIHLLPVVGDTANRIVGRYAQDCMKTTPGRTRKTDVPLSPPLSPEIQKDIVRISETKLSNTHKIYVFHFLSTQDKPSLKIKMLHLCYNHRVTC